MWFFVEQIILLALKSAFHLEYSKYNLSNDPAEPRLVYIKKNAPLQ